MAWGMFLSIPCPCKIWDEKARPWQLVYLPVAGLLVGALWALAAYALGSFDRLPALRAAVLAALPFLLTGFLHLDGFMDCCDAILSRRDLPTRQKILKDSHVGSFAVVCTIFLMLAAFAAFWDFDAKEGWQGLILLPVFSRKEKNEANMISKALRDKKTSNNMLKVIPVCAIRRICFGNSKRELCDAPPIDTAM